MTVTEATDRLTDAEYKAVLEDLRAYKARLEAADRQTDSGSLDVAARLALVYEDRRWVDEMPAVTKTHFRGRPVVPDSRSRFANWVVSKVGLRPAHSYRLLNADELARILSPLEKKFDGATEGALRPLSKLLREKRADEATDVWRRAVELADGGTPTNVHVRKALADHDKATGRVSSSRARAYEQRTVRDAKAKLLREFEYLLLHGTREDIQGVLLEIQRRLEELTAQEASA